MADVCSRRPAPAAGRSPANRYYTVRHVHAAEGVDLRPPAPVDFDFLLPEHITACAGLPTTLRPWPGGYGTTLDRERADAELLLKYVVGKPAPAADPDRLELGAWRLVQPWPLVAELVSTLTEGVARLKRQRATGAKPRSHLPHPQVARKHLGPTSDRVIQQPRNPEAGVTDPARPGPT